MKLYHKKYLRKFQGSYKCKSIGFRVQECKSAIRSLLPSKSLISYFSKSFQEELVAICNAVCVHLESGVAYFSQSNSGYDSDISIVRLGLQKPTTLTHSNNARQHRTYVCTYNILRYSIVLQLIIITSKLTLTIYDNVRYGTNVCIKYIPT
jgi:hypothetical protein